MSSQELVEDVDDNDVLGDLETLGDGLHDAAMEESGAHESVPAGGARGARALAGLLLFSGCAAVAAPFVPGLLPSAWAGASAGFVGGGLGLVGCSIVLLSLARVAQRITGLGAESSADPEEMRIISHRVDQLAESFASFEQSMQQFRSDKLVATVNQIRYEVSALHEKVHRELFPSKDMQPVLAEISGTVGRVLEVLDHDTEAKEPHFDRLEDQIGRIEARLTELSTVREGTEEDVDSGEIQEFCATMQDALHRLSPGLEQLQSTVESSTSAADQGLQKLADLVTRLETELRDLDTKADRILDLSGELHHSVGVPRAAPAQGGEHPVEGDAPSDATVDPEPHEVAPAKDRTTFLSAVERLKNLRGD